MFASWALTLTPMRPTVCGSALKRQKPCLVPAWRGRRTLRMPASRRRPSFADDVILRDESEVSMRVVVQPVNASEDLIA